MLNRNAVHAARTLDGSIRWGAVVDMSDGKYVVSKLMVCKSAAGYYPGRMCYSVDMNIIEPYDREEMYGYLPTEELAQECVNDYNK